MGRGYHRAVIVAAALASSVIGCQECETRRTTFDVVPGEPLYEFDRGRPAVLRSEGWTCESVPLRNDLGERIGDRYTCTICD